MAVSNSKFAGILSEALAAGAAAGAAIVPVPMVVRNEASNKEWFVGDGVCGFGWVEFAGNTAFGKWAKKNGHARAAYPKGLSIWSKLMTQSMARNEAWAMAVSEVLNANGIAASARSRID